MVGGTEEEDIKQMGAKQDVGIFSISCLFSTFQTHLNTSTHTNVSIQYTECNRRKGPDFGRVFLMLNYTEKPQNTYIQS